MKKRWYWSWGWVCRGCVIDAYDLGFFGIHWDSGNFWETYGFYWNRD